MHHPCKKYIVISSSLHKKDSNILHHPILATWAPPLSMMKLTSICSLTVALNCNTSLVPMAAPKLNTLLNQLLFRPVLHIVASAVSSFNATPSPTVNSISPAPSTPHSSSLMYWSHVPVLLLPSCVKDVPQAGLSINCHTYLLSLARQYYSEIGRAAVAQGEYYSHPLR